MLDTETWWLFEQLREFSIDLSDVGNMFIIAFLPLSIPLTAPLGTENATFKWNIYRTLHCRVVELQNLVYYREGGVECCGKDNIHGISL